METLHEVGCGEAIRLSWIRRRLREVAGTARSGHRGQSLAEFAVALPIFLLLVLGTANLGLAIRAHIQLSQVAQQAAQMLVHNPEYADPLVVSFTGADGGTFTLTTSGGTGGTTSAIPYSSSLPAATVAAALASLPDVNGAGNVTVSGSGGGPYTVVFTGTATATGLSVDESQLTSTSAVASATVTPPVTLVAYMNSLSSYQFTPSEVKTTITTTTQPPITTPYTCDLTTTYCALLDRVQISYPFPLLFPMIGKLSVGLLRNGTINLGTTESTVAATHPVSNVRVCYTKALCQTSGIPASNSVFNQVGTTGHLIYWQAPAEALSSPNVPIANYCITAYYVPTASGPSAQPQDLPVPNSTANGCVNSSTSGGSLSCVTAPASGPLYCVDTTDYTAQAANPGQVFYRVAAQQVDGIASAYSDRVDSP